MAKNVNTAKIRGINKAGFNKQIQNKTNKKKKTTDEIEEANNLIKYTKMQSKHSKENKISNEIGETNDKNNYPRKDDHLLETDMIPPDIENLKLPNIAIFSNFASSSSEKSDLEKKYPQIIDLCDDDRMRISQLVEEIARFRERNIQDTKILTVLQEEKFNMTMEISKLEKEITELLSNNQEKENEIIQLNRKYDKIIQEQKMQFTEMKLRMEVNQKHSEEKQKEMKSKIEALKEKNEILTVGNNQLSVKYSIIKKKLRKAIQFIKQIRGTVNILNKTEEKYCHVTAPIEKQVSGTNLDKNFPVSEQNCHEEQHPTISHSKSELSLLSDLFFKGPSLNSDDSELIII